MKPQLILISSILFLLSSCSNTHFISSRVDQIDGRMEKVFVYIQNQDDLLFFDYFEYNLLDELASTGVRTKIFHHNMLSLETEDEIEEMINAFQPTHVMVIEKVLDARKTVMDVFDGEFTEVVDGGTYLVTLEQPSDKRIIWKGKLTTDELLVRRQAARKSAQKIVDDLVESNLL